jgi:hypothetical protein
MFWNVRAMPSATMSFTRPGDIASGETHGAFSGLVDAGDQIEDGGLPGAIRADEPAEFALAWTAKSTALTAVRPPKRIVT